MNNLTYFGDRRLDGYIWPMTDSDSELKSNSSKANDRMINQLRYIDEFWPPGPNGTTSSTIYRMKVILKVGTFNFENFKPGQEYFVNEGCPVDACMITGDSKLYESADALLISEFGRFSSWKYLPKPAHQIWIAQHWESPKHNRIDPGSVKNLINWTASYRRDSTLQVGYGHFAQVCNKPIQDFKTRVPF